MLAEPSSIGKRFTSMTWLRNLKTSSTKPEICRLEPGLEPFAVPLLREDMPSGRS